LAVGIVKIVQSQTDLPQIVQTAYSIGRGARLLHCRKQEPEKDANYPDNHQ
jgi:hypothetical protein